MRPLKLQSDAWKDHKKLTKFLSEVMTYINKIVKGCQLQTRLTASELVSRPTYAEEFQNIRENIHKAVVPENDGTFSDGGSVMSGRSGRSTLSVPSMVSFNPRAGKRMKVETAIIEEELDEDDLDTS